MDMIQYHKSLSREMNSLRDRIRTLMEDPHWQTDGEWKESVLRNVLRRHLPSSVDIGRGFVINAQTCSKQIDVLIFDKDAPIIFRDGDLVFLTPDAVKGIIEVKSTATIAKLGEAIDNMLLASDVINRGWSRANHPRFRVIKNFIAGIFAYESEIEDQERVFDLLVEKTGGVRMRAINLISLGEKLFLRFWEDAPGLNPFGSAWYAYNLEDLTASYFVGNIALFCSPSSVQLNPHTWFPLESKEPLRSGFRRL